jgi:hypothetical protein
MAPTAQQPLLATAAEELAQLLHAAEGSAMQDRLIRQRLPDLFTTLEAAGLRLITFCQCYPERFSLRFVPGWGVRVSLAPAPSEPAPDLPQVESALEATVAENVEKFHAKHCLTKKEPAAPLAWLIRRIGPELDSLLVQSAQKALHYHLDPAASGYDHLRAAVRGCIACHLWDFVAARGAAFRWVEGEPCGGWHARCHCQGAIALAPERAAAVMAARRARAKAEEAKLAQKRAAREARRALEAATLEQEPACWREGAELTTAQLLSACAAGGALVLLRAPVRSAALFGEELRAAARHAALPPALLRPLERGLWLLPPPAAGDEAGGSAREALLALLPCLGGARLALRLLAAAPSDDADALVVAAAALPRRHVRWSLELEQHFPSPISWWEVPPLPLPDRPMRPPRASKGSGRC